MMHKRSKSCEPYSKKMEERIGCTGGHHTNTTTSSDDSTAGAAGRPPSSASAAAAQCSTVSVFLAKINGAARLVTAVWTKSLINQSFTISIDRPSTSSTDGDPVTVTHKVELKPWPFWSKKGCKVLDIGGGDRVEMFWDLRSAKFTSAAANATGGGGASSPEPGGGYYVALVSNDEVVLLLGDCKEAYKRTKARPSLEEAALVCRRESVFGRRSFAARARLDGRRSNKEHEIVIDYALAAAGSSKDPEMWITVDGFVLLHVRSLQWKFRGNETLLVDQAPVQVIWDVHDWLFAGPGTQAVFVFKPGAPPEILEDNGGNGLQFQGEGTTDFCFFLQAWRTE